MSSNFPTPMGNEGARLRSYHDVIFDVQAVRDAVLFLGRRHGGKLFAGPFDLSKVCMAYLKDPEKRAEINRVVGVG